MVPVLTPTPTALYTHCNPNRTVDADKPNATELLRILKDAGQAVPPALAKYQGSKLTFNYDSDE